MVTGLNRHGHIDRLYLIVSEALTACSICLAQNTSSHFEVCDLSRFSLQLQMAAACTAHPYEASRVLGVRDERRPNGIPSRDWLSEHFSFTARDLREFIKDAPLRANEIHNTSLNNRASPAPYIVDVDGGFHVGWYDGTDDGFSAVMFHEHLEDAATDFVLTYWGMPRLPGKPISNKAETDLFNNKYSPPLERAALRRGLDALRDVVRRWRGVK